MTSAMCSAPVSYAACRKSENRSNPASSRGLSSLNSQPGHNPASFQTTHGSFHSLLVPMHTDAHSCGDITPLFTRRDLLKNFACGFGWLAFTGLADHAFGVAANPLRANAPHFPARAERRIFLVMRGVPSHVDTFDYKPKLTTDSGKAGKRPGTKLLGSKWEFKPRGRSGMRIADLFPSVAQHADELCLIRSMQTDLPSHPQAFVRLHTGNSQFVRPSLGAWSLYGLGTLNENLPGFVTITPPGQFGGAQNYGSAFLPAIYQGMKIGNDGRGFGNAEIRNLQTALSPEAQRVELELIQTLNRHQLERDRVNPDIEGVIESFELAFKMQTEMPVVMDLSKETEATKKLYGIGAGPTDDMGRKCLLARRLVESGVRFV